LIDLYYGDESRVCLEPCAPYGWQFADEEVFMPSRKGPSLNCFALLSRDNRCVFETTQGYVNALWVATQLEKLSWQTWERGRISVVVLDNAPVHTGAELQKRRADWEARGLFVFFLPPYSPHLNIAETLWRKLKYEWLAPHDYSDPQNLFCQVRLALAAVGTSLFIRFAPFALGST
jgi:transposase